VALTLIQGDVLTDFSQTAQRADMHRNRRCHLIAARRRFTVAPGGFRSGRLGILPLLRIARPTRTRRRHTLCRRMIFRSSCRTRCAALVVFSCRSISVLLIFIRTSCTAGRRGMLPCNLCIGFALWFDFFHENLQTFSRRDDTFHTVCIASPLHILLCIPESEPAFPCVVEREKPA